MKNQKSIDKIKTMELLISVFLPGNKNDKGWSESGYLAGKHLQDIGLHVEIYERVTEEKIKPLINELLEMGNSVFIGHGCEFFEQFLCVAHNCDSSYFFVMDKLTEPNNWPSNFACLYQKQFEAAYLGGRLAGQLTKTGNVGFLAGMSVPTQVSNATAFKKGVKDYNTSCEVQICYAESFTNPELGKKIAGEMINNDADVLMHSASETGNGLIEICVEKKTHVIGYILDQSHMGRDVVVANLILDAKQIYKSKIDEILSGNFKPGVWHVGVEDNFVDLMILQKMVPSIVIDDIIHTKQELIDGAIQLGN